MKLYQIDAFASELFGGNPAAVVPLDGWLPESRMQAIAAENNLAETAFFVPFGSLEDSSEYYLRWFTPTQEVPLCGHATLASAFVILTGLSPALSSVTFTTQSGLLTVRRAGEMLQMDFPKHDMAPVDAPAALRDGLRLPPRAVYWTSANPNFYAVYESASEVHALAPDFALLAALGSAGIAVTAPGDGKENGADFISRYFAPGLGIPEDPVTGSIHCALAPYWAGRLGKTALHARQASARSGELFCEIHGERVLISGSAVKYLEGEIFV